MKKTSLISIIVPVYNVEKYLERCINSLISQTYNNIEILLIDDGSTDKSGKRIDEMSLKDDRLKIFHKKNGGVSSARNYGLKKSNGKFVTFVDSDDYVDKDYIKVLAKYQSEGDFDIVVSNAIDFNDNGVINTKNRVETNIIEEKNSMIFHFLKQDIFTPVCWGRLYKKKVIEDLKFDINMRIAEDGKFFLDSIEKGNQFIVIKDRLYYYYLRENSTVHSGFNDKFYDELNFCETLRKKYVNNSFLYQNAVYKELYFLYNCLTMKAVNNEEELILLFNKLYREYRKRKPMLIVKKVIVNNKYLRNYVKGRK